jgi:hypothetical protein
MQLIMTTVLPIGMLVFGPIADIITIEFLLILTGVLMALPGVWIFLQQNPAIAPSDLTMGEDDWQGSASQQPGD